MKLTKVPSLFIFNLLPLDVSVAFPQATPASTFPPCGMNFIHYSLFLALLDICIAYIYASKLVEMWCKLELLDCGQQLLILD